MKKVLLALMLLTLIGTGSFSQALYSSTATFSRFNPGVGPKGTPIVAYDDVSIPTTGSQVGDSISITKIKVGIRRTPNAPATNVSIYYTPFSDEKGIAKEQATNIFLGKVALAANGSSLNTTVVELGDSIATLLKIKKDTEVGQIGYQKILIGASLDNPSAANGIVLTRDDSRNADSIWVVNADTDKMLYATNFSGQRPASYYLEVFGSVSGNTPQDNPIVVVLNDRDRAITMR